MASTTLAARAIRWYDVQARDLPWRRRGTTAWAVLVSEVMLQQTPVARVIPVWEEWRRCWPAPADLAAETPGQAVRAWGRLGYPRRALRLHDCATIIVSRHNGEVPADVDRLRALPGVGDYTARAVAAFAFGQRHPVVDTNVRRLIARVVSGRPEGGAATTAADLGAVAALLPQSPARAARASAAFMELGALLCTARNPACRSCPLRARCAWRLAGHPPAQRTRPAQRYAGTDRHARGALLALARESDAPVAVAAFAAAWADADQRQRALTGLLADGLLEPAGAGWYSLPGGSRPGEEPGRQTP